MFERFTADARQVVVGARDVAREVGAAEITPTHLLTVLVKTDRILAELGVSEADVLDELARVRRRGGMTEADAEALAELGIDVEQVVDRVERTHGPDALAHRRPGRRGQPRFAAQSKKTLELSLREAVRMGARHVGQECILLALAQQRGTDDVLARRGADYLTLRRIVGERKAG